MFVANIIIKAVFSDLDETKEQVEATCEIVKEKVLNALQSLNNPALLMDGERDVAIEYSVS